MTKEPASSHSTLKNESPRLNKIPAATKSPLESSLWLKEAIAMEQSLLRKIMEMADNIESLLDLLDLLEITSRAHNRLASLLRTQNILTGNANDAHSDEFGHRFRLMTASLQWSRTGSMIISQVADMDNAERNRLCDSPDKWRR
jgi:hypothetical protein